MMNWLNILIIFILIRNLLVVPVIYRNDGVFLNVCKLWLDSWNIVLVVELSIKNTAVVKLSDDVAIRRQSSLTDRAHLLSHEESRVEVLLERL